MNYYFYYFKNNIPNDFFSNVYDLLWPWGWFIPSFFLLTPPFTQISLSPNLFWPLSYILYGHLALGTMLWRIKSWSSSCFLLLVRRRLLSLVCSKAYKIHLKEQALLLSSGNPPLPLSPSSPLTPPFFFLPPSCLLLVCAALIGRKYLYF